MILKYLILVLFVSFVKLTFLYSYVSTDFEVHRNWLAITNSLPISKWYYEASSKWTLDYPPLFAWFELALSQVARIVDGNITRVDNLEYISWNTRVFQKVSVILADLVFAYAVFKLLCCKPVSKSLADSMFLVLTALKMLAPFGLLLIDHIHFQYNGLLFGLLFLSFYCIFKKKEIWAAFWFAVLLNFKHIYIYYAPAYGMYLLWHYCYRSVHQGEDEAAQYYFDYKRFLRLGAVVISVFAASFGPFVVMGQTGQVLRRLFPFDQRGLTHAYWAPNFWALYNGADLVLARLTGSKLPGGSTRGLVESYRHSALPSISPGQTLMLTAVFLLPAIFRIKNKASHLDFLKLTILAGWVSFSFGWHVHEKAVLMVTLPLMLLEQFDRRCLGIGFYVSTVAHFSLLPLIPTGSEYSLKLTLWLATTSTHYVQAHYLDPHHEPWQRLPRSLRLHLIGLLPVLLCADWLLPRVMPQLAFLPLVLYSVYCAFGLFLLALPRFYLFCWTDSETWLLPSPLFCSTYDPVTPIKKTQ